LRLAHHRPDNFEAVLVIHKACLAEWLAAEMNAPPDRLHRR